MSGCACLASQGDSGSSLVRSKEGAAENADLLTGDDYVGALPHLLQRGSQVGRRVLRREQLRQASPMSARMKGGPALPASGPRNCAIPAAQRSLSTAVIQEDAGQAGHHGDGQTLSVQCGFSGFRSKRSAVLLLESGSIEFNCEFRGAGVASA
jgi:hypothetical protein